MAHSHCIGPETGPGPGMMGLYIMLCTVHTTLRQGTGMGTNGLHTHFPVSCPVPGPVQCESSIIRVHQNHKRQKSLAAVSSFEKLSNFQNFKLSLAGDHMPADVSEWNLKWNY